MRFFYTLGEFIAANIGLALARECLMTFSQPPHPGVPSVCSFSDELDALEKS